MDWFRCYHEAPTDPKWLVIGRAVGCPPGVVSAVWFRLMAHASQQTPRGSIAGFDVDTYAAFSGWDADLVRRIIEEMERACGPLISNGTLRRWVKRNGPKGARNVTVSDPTNAERQRRYRERQKQKAAQEQGATTPDRNDSNAPLRPLHPHRNARNGLQGEQSSPSVGEASRGSTLDTPNNLSRNARAQAHAQSGMSAGEIWERLESEGLAPGFLARRYHASTIQRWTAGQLTEHQLGEAITRARAARKRAGSDQPISLGYLDTILADVVAGRPAIASNRMEQTDDAAARYVAGRLGG